jgi:cellobiose phosphorylase
MTLTGQVFTLMSGIASNEQAEQIIRSVDHYLFDANLGGCRLNTDFKESLMNMGRCFGFAYGHKENGAVFSHMAVMYAYALYTRGYALQAYKVLNSIYRQSINFQTSRMYPGIPEYFTPRGRGVYPYLTGSASWYIYTLLTQAFGIRAEMGDLVLDPKLALDQFDAQSEAAAMTRFADRRIRVVYQNPERLEYGSYRIIKVSLDDQELPFDYPAERVRIPRQRIAGEDDDRTRRLTVLLGQNSSAVSG